MDERSPRRAIGGRASGAGGDARAPEPPADGYAAALAAGTQALVRTVQDMHIAISDKAFDAARWLPGLSLPVRVVQGVHDAISHGAYGAVRHGSGAALRAAGVVEQLAARTSGAAKDRGHERGHVIRRALNGAFGDALAQAGNPVSVAMGFYSGGSRLPLTRGSLHALRSRVCIFIHGLGCDENSWQREDPEWAETTWSRVLPPGASMHYGALLASEFNVSPIYLRYNTGLPLAENARRLAVQLEQLLGVAPARLREITLVGHSMGGLVARSASELAKVLKLTWPRYLRMVVTLGSPNQGARLEQLGHLVDLALGLSSVTRPLARIGAARSQGIKDLRHGLDTATRDRSAVESSGVPLRLIAANLSAVPRSIAGRLVGDGLVARSSAWDDGIAGDVQRVELARMGHMALLNNPRVYAYLRGWMRDGSRVPARRCRMKISKPAERA